MTMISPGPVTPGLFWLPLVPVVPVPPAWIPSWNDSIGMTWPSTIIWGSFGHWATSGAPNTGQRWSAAPTARLPTVFCSSSAFSTSGACFARLRGRLLRLGLELLGELLEVLLAQLAHAGAASHQSLNSKR